MRSSAQTHPPEAARDQAVQDSELAKQTTAALTRQLAVEPSVQYLINPDNFYNPEARELSGNGFVVGLQVTLDVVSLLGL